MNYFNKDYYENGISSGLSLYTNYKWMPDLTIPMAFRIIEILNIKESDSILDFGCAKGYMVKSFRMLYRDAYGVDISDYAISNCDKEVENYLLKIEDIKTLIRTIVSWEGTPEYEYHDVKSRVDRFMSSDVGVVDEIYRKETGETTIEKPKPRLSRSTLRKLNKAGLNRENMSNEQLAAIKKLIEGTRVTKIINYFSFASLLITVLMLYLRRWELVIALFLISY